MVRFVVAADTEGDEPGGPDRAAGR
jgi:hypothetical protein